MYVHIRMYVLVLVNEAGNDSTEENVVTISSQVNPVAAVASVGSHKLKDSDPLVLHVLPSAVTAECEYLLYMYAYAVYVRTYSRVLKNTHVL